MIIVSYFLLPIQVPPRLRLFCPLANSALTFGSAGSSWQSRVRNIMEKWLTWWFQGDYRFRGNNLVDGKGRRIPPGSTGAEQILNSVIIGLPSFQHIWVFLSESGRRDAWDAPGAHAARMRVGTRVSSLCSTGCQQLLHHKPILLCVLRGIARLRGALQTCPDIFSKFRPEHMLQEWPLFRVYAAETQTLLRAAALVLVAEIDHSGLCTAPLSAIRLVLFEIQMIEISILAGDGRM